MTDALILQSGRWVPDGSGEIPPGMARIRVNWRCADSETGRRSAHADGGSFSGTVAVCAGVDHSFRPTDRVAGFAPRAAVITMPTIGICCLPPTLTGQQGAVLALLGLAVRAARRARVREGMRALVLGRGVLADLVALALRCSGAMNIVVLAALPSGSSNGSRSPACTDPEIAIDTTGDPTMLVRLLESTARLGRIVLLGSTRGQTVDVDFYQTVHKRGLEVIGVSDDGPLTSLGSVVGQPDDIAAAAVLFETHGQEIAALTAGAVQCEPE